jgi:hypothetical protein
MQGVHFSLDGVLYLRSVEYLDLKNAGEKNGWNFAKPLLKARAGFALFESRCPSEYINYLKYNLYY